MAITGVQLQGMFRGLFPGDTAGGLIDKMAQGEVYETYAYLPYNSNSANTVLALGTLPYSVLVTEIKIQAGTVNVAKHNSTYAVLRVDYDDAAGGAVTSIASSNTTSVAGQIGSLTINYDATLLATTSAPVAVASGNQLRLNITQISTGMTITNPTVKIRYKITGT